MSNDKTTPHEPKTINVWIEEEEDLSVHPAQPDFLKDTELSIEEIRELENKQAEEENNRRQDL